MLQCWEFEPDRRPTFSRIVDTVSHFLEGMVDYMDISTFAGRNAELTASNMMSDDSKSDDVITTVFMNERFIQS